MRIARLYKFCTNEGAEVQYIKDDDDDYQKVIPFDITVTDIQGDFRATQHHSERTCTTALGEAATHPRMNSIIILK
jgi:hypothetical protein